MEGGLVCHVAVTSPTEGFEYQNSDLDSDSEFSGEPVQRMEMFLWSPVLLCTQDAAFHTK